MEAKRIVSKYPERIPVIVEKAERGDIADIDKKKYLVPADLTVGQFQLRTKKNMSNLLHHSSFWGLFHLPTTDMLFVSV